MKFEELALHEDIMKGLEAMNFEEMTPVQEQTIPVILRGDDLIGCAQTGTGKTAAYTLPLLEKLSREGNPENVVRSLIVVPTRELAQQIDVQFQGFSYFLPVSTTVVYGGGDGAGWSQQKQGMLMGSDIVVATPGRLLAHITNSGIDLSHVTYFVLDEADRMRNPTEISIAISKPNEAIEQGAYVLYERQKMELIHELFGVPQQTKTIIFASSKQKVKELAFALKRMKLNVAPMHSDLTQEKREEVMLDFKNGKIDILVATDIVARGIDIEDIGTVVNYDVPHDPEDYIHRIGRTARASATGRAITFVNEYEQGKFHRIEQFIERDLPKLPLPERLGPTPVYEPGKEERRGGRGSGKGRGAGRSHNRSRRPGDAGEKRPTPGKAASTKGPSDSTAQPVPQPQQGTNGEAPRRKKHHGRFRRKGQANKQEPRNE